MTRTLTPERTPTMSFAGRPRPLGAAWSALVLGAAAGFVALGVTVGADALWLVATGRWMLRTGEIAHHVPFAAAAHPEWPNVPAVGELVFAAWYADGERGLAIMHLLAAMLAWGLVVVAARRRGAGDAAAALALGVVVLAVLPAWGVVRLQSLSYVCFALLMVLLLHESARPSRWIWLAPVLVAIWGNLHGAVLLGVCVLGAYLVGSRLWLQPRTAIGVGLASLVALLANPALLRAPEYYHGVLTNEAARSREQLWAPLRLDSGFDIALAVGGLVLLVALTRARPRIWELIAIVGLGFATVTAARNGVWFLLTVAPIAATGFQRDPAGPGQVRPGGHRGVVAAIAVLLIGATLPMLVGRSHHFSRVDPQTVRTVSESAGGRVVLAPDPLVESLAVAGVRVWAGNPIDAFDAQTQRAYLAFVSVRGDWSAAAAGSQVVVLDDTQAPRVAALPGFREVSWAGLPSGWKVFERVA